MDETSDNYFTVLSQLHETSAEEILQLCLRNGGIYIKLGQGLVSLSHVLPKEYIRKLKQLQDQCLVRKTKEIEQVFQEDFGFSYREIFEEFNETPIAAASLAQVEKKDRYFFFGNVN